MKRFFAFGCSFTQYDWPTWADCIGAEFDVYENWGKCGGGNHYIFNSVMECNQRNHFTKDDVVIVQWTNPFREDRWLDMQKTYDNGKWAPGCFQWDTGWITPGNLATQRFYNEEFVKRYGIGSERGYFVRDMAYIAAVKHLLNGIGCNWHFLAMRPLTDFDQYQYTTDNTTKYDDIETVYKDALDCIKPSFLEVVFNGVDWVSKRPVQAITDGHPLPMEHIDFVDKILPEFNISQDTRDYCSQVQQNLIAQNTAFPSFENSKLKSVVKTRL